MQCRAQCAMQIHCCTWRSDQNNIFVAITFVHSTNISKIYEALRHTWFLYKCICEMEQIPVVISTNIFVICTNGICTNEKSIPIIRLYEIIVVQQTFVNFSFKNIFTCSHCIFTICECIYYVCSWIFVFGDVIYLCDDGTNAFVECTNYLLYLIDYHYSICSTVSICFLNFSHELFFHSRQLFSFGLMAAAFSSDPPPDADLTVY